MLERDFETDMKLPSLEFAPPVMATLSHIELNGEAFF